MKTLSQLKAMFLSQVNTSHIKCDTDAGHTYFYIDHPIMDEFVDNDEMLEFIDEWISKNEPTLP